VVELLFGHGVTLFLLIVFSIIVSVNFHYKKKGKLGRLISSSWWRSAAASTFSGGIADSSNRRRCLCFFLTFSLFNKTIETLCALSSFTLPQISGCLSSFSQRLNLFAPFVYSLVTTYILSS
jgi:hypothetical protein